MVAKKKAAAKKVVKNKKITSIKKQPIANKVKEISIKPIGKVTKVLSKSELCNTVANSLALNKKQVADVFDKLSDVIAAHLKKGGPEKFVLPGLLKIVVRKVPARPAKKGKNPFTGEPMTFKAKPASKKIKVLPLKNLKTMC